MKVAIVRAPATWMLATWIFGVTFAGCAASSQEAGGDGRAALAESPPGERVFGSRPIEFRFSDATGGPDLTAERLRGRRTVIALLATYDLASQAQAHILTSIERAHQPRINVAGVVLEPEANRTLVAAFRDALGLDYPVAIVDPRVFAETSPFGDMAGVPSVLILDADGRIVWRHPGLARSSEIESALARP